ncbi:RibD family protein [Thiohalobacter thiocyanaticus]|nr:dihydrofolate reductase family protein [Thiohalobacter thiocyanaticus]
MSEKSIQQLYPRSEHDHALEGLYLNQRLHRRGQAGLPFVYTNFISSLDGRIGVGVAGRDTHQVPPAIANPRDWRLFQELGAQADLLITSARYFREYALGQAQDTLPVGAGQKFDDLRRWRLDQGLAPQPDIAIISASLDIPAAALAAYPNRRLHLLTGADADPGRVRALEQAGVETHYVGDGHQAEAGRAIDALAAAGYRSVYAIGGPHVLNTLLQAGRLDRLYLTFAGRILGGEDFSTFVYGSHLDPAPRLQLAQLHYDPLAPEGCGQLLGCYDLVR